MKNTIKTCLFLILSACGLHAAQAEVLLASTSVKPVAVVMERIGVGHWHVQALVEEGKSPHTFALTPKLAAGLSASSVYLAVGVELDESVVRRAPKTMRVVDVVLNEIEGVDADDPHAWLDPEGLIIIAKASRDAFASSDPTHASDYETACAAFENDVSAASEKAKAILAPYKDRRFYVQHDAFTRFAATYGLVQIAAEEHEKEPTAERLVELTRLAQSDGVKVLYSQPGQNPRPLEVIAESIGAKIGTLNPVPSDPLEDLVIRAQTLADSFAAETMAKADK